MRELSTGGARAGFRSNREKADRVRGGCRADSRSTASPPLADRPGDHPFGRNPRIQGSHDASVGVARARERPVRVPRPGEPERKGFDRRDRAGRVPLNAAGDAAVAYPVDPLATVGSRRARFREFPETLGRSADTVGGMDAASFEECFEHRAWVRALAERLCADAEGARELEQATWLEVARGGAAPRSARAWLGGIVRHLARRERRRDLARGARERSVARAEAVPSADALLAQAELQRRVLTAVAELDEAQRVVVLMRYYEGLDGAEIARRLGCPSSTVRNRLARAHARLRERLDREYSGERRAWAFLLAPAFALESGARAATIGAGVAMKLGIACAAALAAAVAVFLWPRRAEVRSESRAEPDALAAIEAPNAVATSGTTPTVPKDASERRAIEAAPAPAAPALVLGDLLGMDELEPDGVRIEFVDANGATRAASIGAQRSYSVFGLLPGAYRIEGAAWGYVPLQAELTLPAGTERLRHDLRFERSLALPVRFVDRANGEAIRPSFVSWTSGLAAIATRAIPRRAPGVFGRAPRYSESGLWREAQRTDRGDPKAGVLEVWDAPPVYASAVLRDAVLESRLLRGDEGELVFEIDRDAIASQLASVALRCVDAESGAELDASIQAWVRDGGGSAKTERVDGATVVRELAPGWWGITAQAQGYARRERWVHLDPGERADLGTIALVREARLRGRVTDGDGHGIAVPLVVLPSRADASPREYESRTSNGSAVDGSFEFGGVESNALRLVAADPERAWTAIDVDARLGAVDGIELVVERGHPVWLRPPSGRRAPFQALVADGLGRVLGPTWIAPVGGVVLRLATGDYELRFVEDDAVVARQRFRVEGERTTVDLQVP